MLIITHYPIPASDFSVFCGCGILVFGSHTLWKYFGSHRQRRISLAGRFGFHRCFALWLAEISDPTATSLFWLVDILNLKCIVLFGLMLLRLLWHHSVTSQQSYRFMVLFVWCHKGIWNYCLLWIIIVKVLWHHSIDITTDAWLYLCDVTYFSNTQIDVWCHSFLRKWMTSQKYYDFFLLLHMWCHKLCK